MKILVVNKMSALEYYYKGDNKSKELKESMIEQNKNISRLKEILDKTDYEIITRNSLPEKNLSDYDFVFSAGGDGTVIAVAAYNQDTPQLNLKTDERSKGALCQQNLEESILKTIKGDYKISEWARQDILLNGKFIGRALNETCIGEQLNFAKMAKYDIEVYQNSRLLINEHQENSGLIIITGTGSTGWPSAFSKYSKSSKIFKSYVIFPVKGHKSLRGDYFRIQYKGHEGKFAVDTVVYELPRDSILEIKISEKPLKVVIPN